MARRRGKWINPFYPLLVLAGGLFAITACAYGLMALKAISPTPGEPGHPLMAFLDHYGARLMIGELLVLAAASFLAMGTDQYWSGGTEAEREPADSRREMKP